MAARRRYQGSSACSAKHCQHQKEAGILGPRIVFYVSLLQYTRCFVSIPFSLWQITSPLRHAHGPSCVLHTSTSSSSSSRRMEWLMLLSIVSGSFRSSIIPATIFPTVCLSSARFASFPCECFSVRQMYQGKDDSSKQISTCHRPKQGYMPASSCLMVE